MKETFTLKIKNGIKEEKHHEYEIDMIGLTKIRYKGRDLYINGLYRYWCSKRYHTLVKEFFIYDKAYKEICRLEYTASMQEANKIEIDSDYFKKEIEKFMARNTAQRRTRRTWKS